jgi:hypothetical protein
MMPNALTGTCMSQEATWTGLVSWKTMTFYVPTCTLRTRHVRLVSDLNTVGETRAGSSPASGIMGFCREVYWLKGQARGHALA